MYKFLELFSGANGQLSSVRAQTWLVILCFCTDWAMHIIRGQEFNPNINVVGLVLGVLGLKVVQRFGEEKPIELPGQETLAEITGEGNQMK
jgi:hypothetical protein